MPKYTEPPAFSQIQSCLRQCGRSMFRGTIETELHFLLRGVCCHCRGQRQRKHCRRCGNAMDKPKSVSWAVWEARRYCDLYCAARDSAPVRSVSIAKSHRRRRLDKLSDPEP